MGDRVDPENYHPVTPELTLVVCLRCGIVTVNDKLALDLHETLHVLLLDRAGSL
jgi:hypothetical protein